ncbi:MAG: hypothetical protein M5U21_05430 [Fimbriimonadaceae bacterium]|nr:hypothetical protein [Fimbriimonadaceae bacterium]
MKEATERRTTMMLGNGTTRKYQFDNRGQLTTQIEFSGATPLCTIVDGYDPVGNRLTRKLDGNPITWSYDDLYRLTGQVKPGQVATYTLDGVGNLKTMWEGGNFPKTFTFNAADRLATMVEGANLTTYAWTGYGALESEITGNQSTGYAYNGQDQLAVVTEPSGDKTTYSFDGDGLRRSVATTNVSQDPPTLDVTTMVWDGSDYLLLSEPTGNRVVLTLDSEIVSCGSKDLLTDPLGSLVKEISTGASLGGLVQLTPYGTLLPTSEEPSTPFIYVAAYGYYYDSIDRDYVRARELYKKLGRWMQTDPLWPAEASLGFVSANPFRFVDPSGLQKDHNVLGEIGAGYLCCANQAKKATEAAKRFCGDYGFGAPDDGTICNAFQHCMWACLIGQECGGPAGLTGKEWAKECTDMHEKDAPSFWKNCPGYRPVPDPYKPNPPDHKCMDLYNNRIGITCSTAQSCERCCLVHAMAGGFQIIAPKIGGPKHWRKPRTDCKKDPSRVVLPSIH